MIRVISALIVLCAVGIGSGNRCPDGGFVSPTNRTKCFKFYMARRDFFEALIACHGGELPHSYFASISNVIENNALRAFALGFGREPFVWIGLKDFYENGEWSWDQDTNTFRRWSPGFPKPWPLATCVAMNTNTGFWMNRDCAERLPFFCSSDAISFPTTERMVGINAGFLS